MAGTYAKYSGAGSGGGGGGGGVTSLNGETGAVTILGGTGITVTPSGQDITIANSESPGITQLTGPVTAGPGSGSQATTLTSPMVITPIAGSTVAGTQHAYPDPGNLNLESTTNATKGYVAIADSSAFAFGDANAVTQDITQVNTLFGAKPGSFMMAFDAAGSLMADNSNNVEMDVYGGTVFINIGSTGGTVASPTYLSSGATHSSILFSTWDGTSPQDVTLGGLEVIATEAQSGSAFGTEIVIGTVPTGTTGLVQSLKLSGLTTTVTNLVANAAVYSQGPVGINVGETIASNVVLDIRSGHIRTSDPATPTSTINANAGTGATITNSSDGDDTAGNLTLTTGSGAWASGAQFTLNFIRTYSSTVTVFLYPANAAAATGATTVMPYVGTTTASGFTINFVNADTAAHTYVWNYLVLDVG
jgi:hypothetical protein